MRRSLASHLPIRIPSLTGTPHPPAPHMELTDSTRLLIDFLKRRRGKTVVLTGAGVSTDSGIRAYRGLNGSYTTNKKHRPIFYHEFIEEESKRRRYWGQSWTGPEITSEEFDPDLRPFAEPNPTHYALAALQKLGHVSHLITQNVDGLHHKAYDNDLTTYLAPPPIAPPTTATASSPSGSTTEPKPLPFEPDILELHGTLRHAHCLSCQTPIGRDAFQDRLSALNPAWAEYSHNLESGKTKPILNPDGDVELGKGVRYEDFNVPACDHCGEYMMKPKVTFFGESLLPHVRDLATSWIESSTQLLVIGSSLATYSAFRLIRLSKDLDHRVGLINVGESRGDGLVDFRIGWEGGAVEVLPPVVKRLLEDGPEVEEVLKTEVEEMMRRGRIKRIGNGGTAA
ncbi:BZ3500_MvSof-1268-A1-R1_Chr9g10333 [Microbotryum saponariae]|uniref:BZ3500_MvSof-1268-A1-R1_Chr9g10333 protein n=1 Tax=Microbotryum saponariae TaxID=289078 RepID=A0A2X0KAG4_9BASI|nr:BZ3501_MvSof-1269-A2-R1_Chr9g10083 [Microbotryum saponariae]SCZ99913.1 BZ3500_MvSof-1268-A1-R1_Chr9g10333 [Microbotryum saponariae]